MFIASRCFTPHPLGPTPNPHPPHPLARPLPHVHRWRTHPCTRTHAHTPPTPCCTRAGGAPPGPAHGGGQHPGALYDLPGRPRTGVPGGRLPGWGQLGFGFADRFSFQVPASSAPAPRAVGIGPARPSAGLRTHWLGVQVWPCGMQLPLAIAAARCWYSLMPPICCLQSLNRARAPVHHSAGGEAWFTGPPDVCTP